MIALGAANLIGHGEALVPGPCEVEGDGLAVIRRDELDAVFEHADALDLIADAEPLEERKVERQQRFADMEARVLVLLDENHAPAALGQKRGDGGTGGSAADDENVAR